MLNVCEIFSSIQGESTYAGTPCTFVRLSGCGLACAWCDTEYAAAESGTEMSIAEIITQVTAANLPMVEITGGEPLMQASTPVLADALVAAGYQVLVETNGARDISLLSESVVRIMDMKCPSSGMSGRMDLANLNRLRATDEVKFVLATRADYEWAQDLIAEYHVAQKCTVLMGAVEGELPLVDLAQWILEDQLPVRLQIRMHRIIWPQCERGV